jgi:hypothetical protein
MLLEAILKYSERAGLAEEAAAIAKAFHVMTIVPNQANDMMDIGRLQGFEVRPASHIKLLSFRNAMLVSNVGRTQNRETLCPPHCCFNYLGIWPGLTKKAGCPQRTDGNSRDKAM